MTNTPATSAANEKPTKPSSKEPPKPPDTPVARTAVAGDLEQRFIEQEDAAILCGKSFDTIRRARRDGKLPDSRTNDKGKVEVSILDLVRAKLLDPTVAAVPVDEFVGKRRVERELTSARTDLAVANARLDDAFRQIHTLHEILIVRLAS